MRSFVLLTTLVIVVSLSAVLQVCSADPWLVQNNQDNKVENLIPKKNEQNDENEDTTKASEIEGKSLTQRTLEKTKKSKSSSLPSISFHPSLTSVSSNISPMSCADATFLLEILTDSFPSETTWQLKNECTNVEELAGGPYDTSGYLYTIEECLSSLEKYTFTIFDSFGDGLCCGWGYGEYKVSFNGEVVAESASFRGYSESTTFGFCGPAPSSEPSLSAQPSKSPSPTATASAPPTSVPTWGLDRIDDRNLPLDSSFNPVPDNEGSGVTAYIVDTGIRISHVDFEGRASYGINTVDNNFNAYDCNGHGTHVAGTVGGARWGVAKSVDLVAVKVLNCWGGGTWSGVIAGLDWIKENAAGPSTVNMSLGGGTNSALDLAVKSLVDAGIPVVVAAGNDSSDACDYSPAGEPSAITVASTTDTDSRSSFSNYGDCIDIFAPGSDIRSAYHASDTAITDLSGTSMAAPHVCGATALFLGVDLSLSPDDIAAMLSSRSTKDAISDVRGSVNELLYVGEVAPTAPPTSIPSSKPSVSAQPSVVPSSLPSSKPSVSAQPSTLPSSLPSSLPSVSAQPSKSLLPSSMPSVVPTPCGDATFLLELLTDNHYPYETTWQLKNECTNEEELAGGPYDTSAYLYTIEECLSSLEKYTFTIFDSHGDGICCSNGYGEYKVTFNGAIVAQGGAFGSSESTTFGFCGPEPSSQPSVSPQPSKSPSPTVTPSATPSSVPSSKPSVSPRPSVSPAPTANETLAPTNLVYSAIIDNGVIMLGVNNEGHLNVAGGEPDEYNPSLTVVGLRFFRDGGFYESISHGAQAEGFGVSYEHVSSGADYWGGANAHDGVFYLVPDLLSTDGTRATTVAQATSLSIKHEYAPSPDTDNLYEVKITYTNTSPTESLKNLRYRRVVDWDIPPSVYSECVSIFFQSVPMSLEYTTDDGFENVNPLDDVSNSGRNFTCPGGVGCPVYDNGPTDHGSLFQFLFVDNDGTAIELGPGESFSFDMFYGAAASKADAESALNVVGAEIVSFGYPPSGAGGCSADASGSPNVYILGFRGVGAIRVFTPAPTRAPSPSEQEELPGAPTTDNSAANLDMLAFLGTISFVSLTTTLLLVMFS